MTIFTTLFDSLTTLIQDCEIFPFAILCAICALLFSGILSIIKGI